MPQSPSGAPNSSASLLGDGLCSAGSCGRLPAVRRYRISVPAGLLVAGCCLAPVVLAGGRTPTPTPPIEQLSGGEKVHTLIDRVVAVQRSLTSLRARFRQTKRLQALKEPAVSTGTLRFLAPDRVRWDYDAPEPMIVLFADGVLTTYEVSRAHADRIHVPARQRRFLRVLTGTEPLDQLMNHFRVTLRDPGGNGPFTLLLEPTHRMTRRKVRKVELEIDRKILLPISVEYVGANGDSTRYEFSDIEIDPKLSAKVFSLEMGKGVQMRTLDTAPKAP